MMNHYILYWIDIMPQCNRCDDKQDYEWYQDFQDRWKLGIKIDINNYKQHICRKKESNNKRNWIEFECKCGNKVRQNTKLIKSQEILRCSECEYHVKNPE